MIIINNYPPDVIPVVVVGLSWDWEAEEDDDVVSVAIVMAIVGLVPGVVFPLQVWISPIEVSSAFLQTEKLPKQRSLEARISLNCWTALHFSALTVATI